ncbi:DNA polymerase III subunit gamma/tau [Leptolyngbya sp. AN02str]|uniref:DNA polymerase III subunit gamma/tau n=1 Tax=Leptolyngbya sp. AN02str TaxID=3423363 RepID=UPI003D31DCD1
MSYEPLHHKYRPQTFAELVGQEAIATTLSNALRQQRIAPAYLFTGARGTGKTSSARIFAKSLNCQSQDVPTAEPCGHCQICRDITRGASLDVIEIDAASNTGVDNIRELIERAQFAPVQCRYKVYVIDEVHMLSNAAFNALLKTLEEPPDRVVFVLATTDPQRVLPTIISRCQRFDFRRIPLEAMVRHLGAIAQKEAISIVDEALQLIAQISQGGLRDAESLLDQLSLLEGDITTERVWDLVGAVPERDLLGLVQAIAQSQPDAMLDCVRRLMDRGREPLIVLQNLTSFYRDLMIAKTAPSRSDLVAITTPTWAAMCELAATLPMDLLQHSQKHLQDHEIQVRNSSQPRLWLEVTLLGLLPAAGDAATYAPVAIATPAITASPSVVTPAATQSAAAQPVAPPAPAPTNDASAYRAEPAPTKIEAIAPPPSIPESVPAPAVPTQPAPAHPPTPAPSTATAAPAQPAPAASVNLDQTWQEVLSLVQPFSTQTMLRQQCRLLAFNGKEARIGTMSQPLFKMVRDRMPNIETAFKTLCQQPVQVSLEVVSVAEATEAAVTPRPQPQATQAHSAIAPSPEPVAHPVSHAANGAASAPVATPALPEPIPESVSTTAATAPPPARPMPTMQPPTPSAIADPIAPSPISWVEEDEVLKAAKSFAEMFNGQIVNLDGGGDDLSSATLASDVDDVDDDDDDIPF